VTLQVTALGNTKSLFLPQEMRPLDQQS